MRSTVDLDDALLWLPAWQLQELMESGELSPVDLLEATLRRAEELNRGYSMFITICGEEAMAEARASEERYSRGGPLSRVDGIPFSVKDTVLTEGVRTTFASLLFEDYVPTEDATPVRRLREAGAVMFGKTNMPEFSGYRASVNLLVPEARNAWDRDRSSGGSSGGSATSVALGVGAVSLGTDGGGSMRLPGAINGIFSLMPSRGRVPIGPAPFAAPLVGLAPMTRDVRDAARFMTIISPPDPSDPLSAKTPSADYEIGIEDGVEGVRMAWSADFGRVKPHDPRVLDVVHEAALVFAELGAVYSEPDLHIEDTFDQLSRDRRHTHELAMEKIRKDHPDLYELGDLLRKVRQDDPAGYKKVAIYLKDRSLPPTALQYTMSIHPNVRDRPTDHLEDVFAEFDILMSPTLDRTAWICGEAGIVPPTYVAYTHIVNNAGFCAASVPAGFVDGLPVGLHLIARPGEEALLFRVCRAFEKARPWAQDRPTIVSVENTQRWVNR